MKGILFLSWFLVYFLPVVLALEIPTPTTDWYNSPPAEPTLVSHYNSSYLLVYLVGYYLLGQFSSMFGRFAYLGHLGYLAMVTIPIGLEITGLNVGALAHQLGSLFPVKWVPDTKLESFKKETGLGQDRSKENSKMGPHFKINSKVLSNKV
ncbi:hypothetical protein DSO57_1020629 [Entomophthora muscae]|uniref:Uncharacterized protein n=1 Tax=Entomophthora muscae TaxID=34485 RepID=A0ACC2S5H6_9FUNG|nr:hypothetical protein DSO57_1020629 [Entomophthora muscae]